MLYLIYQESDGYVVEIVEQEPTNVVEGLLVAQSDVFNVGDEFTYYIVVNDVNEDGIVTSHAAIRQAPAV